MDNNISSTAAVASEEEGWSLCVQIILGALFIAIILVNIIGNTCTLVAYCRDPKLRTIPNYYICNLAITDLSIGLISAPCYAVYVILNYSWPFGYAWCKGWSVLDYLACTESSLTIILISFDRLMMVRKGALYITYCNKTRTVVIIVCSWLAAFFLYGPSIIGFDAWRGSSIVEDGDCDVEFATSLLFTLITAILEFCVPFFLVVTFNSVIYWNIRKRTRQIQPQLISPGSNPQTGCTDTLTTASKNLWRDRKAAKSLALIAATFLVCWTPYTVTAVCYAICGDSCINEDMYEIFSWLLWLNSSLNPFLYAYTNERFADHYKRLLCGYKKMPCLVQRSHQPTKVKPIFVVGNAK